MRNPFKRAKPAPQKKNYAFAQANRLTNDFFSGSLTADQAVFQSIAAMRNRARTLERDDSHVRKFLHMARASIVGAKGIRAQSRAGDWHGSVFTPNKNDQHIIESAYQEFSKAWNFSINGRLNRRRFAQIGMQRVLVDGEFIAQKIRGSGPFGFSLHMIDAEQLDHTFNRNPASGRAEIRMGVEIDSTGRPLAYHFLSEAPVQWTGVATTGQKRKRVDADQILHLFIEERPGQSRGVTWLAPSGLRAKVLDGIETAVTTGYKVAASKMGFIIPGDDYEGDEITPDDVPTDVAPGMIDILPKGASFSDFDPGYPNADFDTFKKSIVREIAGGFGVSYSAGQIGVQSDIAFWADLQQFWIDAFEEPVFRVWLLMAITAGGLNLPLSKLWKFQAVKFQPPRRKHIDPLKTHNAQRVALGDMTRSPFEIAAENGEDLEDIMDDFARARQLAEDRNLPVPESWANGVALNAITENEEEGIGKWL